MLECGAGYYYNVYVGYYHGDGISRVANAFYVLYSRNPHLGAIGFVWNPLPSMVDLLFLLFYRWIPAMATKGIAGLLMSSLFASLTASLLAQSFIRRKLPVWVVIVFPLLFSFCPMIFLFGFNGLSDISFIYFAILSIISFLNWLEAKSLGDLVISSFALALSFWSRYEAVPFGASLIVGSLIAVIMLQKQKQPPNEGWFCFKWSQAEGICAIVATPIFYSGILWLLFNYIFMNNPLNFLNGDYTNIAQIEGHQSEALYAAMLGNPWQSLLFAGKKVLVFSAPLLAILVLRLLNRRLFQWDTLILLGMFVSIPMLQVLMLMAGTTLGWLRYFIYVLPVSMAWLPYELSKIKRRWQLAIPLAALLINFGVNTYAITQPVIAPDENTFIQNSFGRHSQTYYDWEHQKGIAWYLDEHYANDLILTDTASAFFIVLQSQFPRHFFITSDYEFKNAISDPIKYDVKYLLVPNARSRAIMSAVNDSWPDLYEKGADWAKLVNDFGDWRLYEITGSTRGVEK